MVLHGWTTAGGSEEGFTGEWEKYRVWIPSHLVNYIYTWAVTTTL